MLPPVEPALTVIKPANPLVQRLKESVPETPRQYRANHDRAGNNQDEFHNGIRHVTHGANSNGETYDQTYCRATADPNTSVPGIWRRHCCSV
jgi:hypothetical protein